MFIRVMILCLTVSAFSSFGDLRMISDFGAPGSEARWELTKGVLRHPVANGGCEITYQKFIPGNYQFPAIVTKFQDPENNWLGFTELELDLQSQLGKDLAFVIELRNQNGHKHVIHVSKNTLSSTARQKVWLKLPPLSQTERIQEMHLYAFQPSTDISYTIYQIGLFRASAEKLLSDIEKKLTDIRNTPAAATFQKRLKQLRGKATSTENYSAIAKLAAEVETCYAIDSGEKMAHKLPEAMRTPSSTPAPATITSSDGRKMRLVWADEFNDAGLPNPKEWDYETGFVRNNEEQYYTHSRLENACMKDGCLQIIARKEKFPNPSPVNDPQNKMRGKKEAEYTAASVTSRQGWSHGRIEIRAKMPYGRGLWPAIWMMGTNFKTENWPTCGEIDILEYLGADPNVAHSGIFVKNGYQSSTNRNLHWTTNGSFPLELPEFVFHVYALEWDSNEIRLLIDNQVKQTMKKSDVEKKSGTKWPFDLPLYLILNTAIGGDWGGMKGIDDTAFPSAYLIDYVRVYQEK